MPQDSDNNNNQEQSLNATPPTPAPVSENLNGLKKKNKELLGELVAKVPGAFGEFTDPPAPGYNR